MPWLTILMKAKGTPHIPVLRKTKNNKKQQIKKKHKTAAMCAYIVIITGCFNQIGVGSGGTGNRQEQL